MNRFNDLDAHAKDVERLLTTELFRIKVERLRSQDNLVGHESTGVFVFEDYEVLNPHTEVVGVTIVINPFEMDSFDGTRMLMSRITQILSESGYLYHTGNLSIEVTGSVYDDDDED